MASNPFNALMDPQQLGASIQNAFQYGTQQRQQAETQRALGEYSQNMSPETAANVARHNPMLGMQLQDREQQRQAQMAAKQEQEMERRITAAALQGDPEARKALAYYNAPFYLQLDDRQKASVDQTMKAVGQQAFSILQRPAEEHGTLLGQALAAMKAQGLDTDQFVLTGDPTADLKAALAMTGQLDEAEAFFRPDYSAVPWDADLVNKRDPAAIEAFMRYRAQREGVQQGGQPQQIFDGPGYEGLAPGTQYIDPNGNVRVKPGGAGGNVSGNFPG